MIRESSMFANIDDKHKIKVGEPNFPVAFYRITYLSVKLSLVAIYL